jgi:hypothetical protein
MAGSSRAARTRRAVIRTVVLALIVGTLGIVGNLPQPASATLAGSSFNGADGSPTSDLAAGAVLIPDPVGNVDTTNYTGGAKEDDLCPPVGTGTASPKDDLDAFYFGSQANTSGVFMYVGWRRIDLTGTTTIDFELNHSTSLAPNCTTHPARTAGDVLLTYDFQGTGPFTLDISKRMWVGTAAAGAWGPASALPAGSFEASINSVGSFGELVVNLTAAGLLSTVGCDSFAGVMPKTRSSSTSFSAAIKDFVAPRNAHVSNCGSISIHKQDDTGASLSGVIFDLYTDVNGTKGVAVVPAQSCTTGADGDCTILDVFPGTYWLVERAAPSGYTGAAPRKVTVGLSANTPADPQVFVNTRKPATVNIIKKDDTGAALAGAGFTLYTDDNGARGTAVSGKTCTTGADGKCSITGILPPGTYWVHETTVPDGYTAAADQQVTLGLDQTVTLTFVDTRKPATINIIKKDDTGAVLAGATFGLFTDDNGAKGSAVSGKTCTTGADGKCSITNILPPGDYWVSETVTPAGHTAAADQAVTLGLNQTVTLTFVDDRLPARVDIVKHDDTGAPLAGATFGLYTDDNGVRGSAVSGKTCTTNAQGKCSITDILPAGTYWLHETVTPTGYSSAPDQKVTLALNQTVELTFVDPRQPARVDIVKTTDAGAPLAGAVFGLYTDDNGSVGSAVSGKTCTTGADGKCSITGILPPATYWVVETTTPAGYATAASQKVTLGLNQTVTLNFVDVRKPIAIDLVKEANGAQHPSADPLITESGALVTYTLTITNGGELPLVIDTLTDSLKANVAASCEQGVGSTLDPGDSFTCTYTANPTANAHNVAAVSAHDVLSRTVNSSDEAFVVPLHPAISVDKTGPAAAHVGDVVTYTFTVTTAGDTPLSDVTVVDPKCSSAPALQTKAGGNTDANLDPGETWTYTCTHTVVAADGNTVVNTVNVSGTDKLDTVVRATDDHTFPVLHPAITLDKSATPTQILESGTVVYSFLVTNTGDTTLSNVTVTDDILGAIGAIDSLPPGESRTLTRSVAVGAGYPPVNVGTAAGTDPLGQVVKATDTQAITVVLAEVIVRPELPRTGASVDRELRLALLLFGLGLFLVFSARRRRAIGDR